MNRMKKWSPTAAYTGMQVAAWSFYAVLLCFSSNVLYSFGFSDSRISVLLGSAAAVSFVLQLAAAELISRHPKIKVWAVLTGIGGVIGACTVRLLLPGTPIGAFALSCVLLQLVPPLVNALGMDTIKRGASTNYSIARGLGSLGYSVFAYLTGFLVRGIGVQMVPVMGGVCAVLLMASSWWYHRCAERDLPHAILPVQETKQEGGFLKKYPLFAVFLGASVLLQLSHNLLSNFMYQIMLTKHGGAAEQGTATAICALVELPVMFFFPLLMRRMRCDLWVRLSSLAVMIKPAIILLSGTPGGVYGAQATQILGYGLYTISSVNYSEMVVGRGESVRAQSYLGATSIVGGLIALTTGGFLCQHLGVPAMVLVSLGCGAIGGVTIALTAEKTK